MERKHKEIKRYASGTTNAVRGWEKNVLTDVINMQIQELNDCESVSSFYVHSLELNRKSVLSEVPLTWKSLHRLFLGKCLSFFFWEGTTIF